MTQVIFDCYYQGGAVLRDQSMCPLDLNGEPLQYTETRVIEDVIEPRPWWLLLIFIAMLMLSKRQP